VRACVSARERASNRERARAREIQRQRFRALERILEGPGFRV
jgi:hypothetical protein